MAEGNKDYGKLVKVLQIITGVLMLVMVGVGIYLIQKYNIKMSNIKNLSAMLTGGTLAVAGIIIGVSVVKSFALVFPPAVIFSVCAYVMPNYFTALVVNLISVALSLVIPYFLGRFTGAGMVGNAHQALQSSQKGGGFRGNQ